MCEPLVVLGFEITEGELAFKTFRRPRLTPWQADGGCRHTGAAKPYVGIEKNIPAHRGLLAGQLEEQTSHV